MYTYRRLVPPVTSSGFCTRAPDQLCKTNGQSWQKNIAAEAIGDTPHRTAPTWAHQGE